MPFAVTKPGGVNNSDFAACFRVLVKWGLNIADLDRAPEPGTGKRWVPVWEHEVDARRFAEEVAQSSETGGWEVVPVQDAVSRGPLGPLDIDIGVQRDSCAYELDTWSRNLVRKLYPNARKVRLLAIFAGAPGNAKVAQEYLWDQVATILTGLSLEQMAVFGGYRIYDPVKEEVVRGPASLSDSSAPPARDGATAVPASGLGVEAPATTSG